MKICRPAGGILVVFLLMVVAVTASAKTPESTGPGKTLAQANARMAWWRAAKFGIFIHWGIYSVAAGLWEGKPVAHSSGEWIMTKGHIPREAYAKLAKQFDPVDFDADRWASLFKEAGASYVVFTTMHHDGFCMFKTSATRYNVVDDTPWHKDPTALLAQACRAQGLRFGTYYSVQNWYNPDQMPDAPDNGHPTYFPTHFAPDGAARYLRYMKTQLSELIAQYHPSVLWFDNSIIKPWKTPDGQEIAGWDATDAHAIFDYVRALDPNVIINNRLGHGTGDYLTPEQRIPAHGFTRPWETCMTINWTWGYKQDDKHWKSTETLLRDLVDIVSKGGNFLLNVGPDGKGVIPQPEVDRLREMGKWLKVNGDSIYGTTRSPLDNVPAWGRVTAKPGRLFLHVFAWPANGKLILTGWKGPIKRAYLLGDAKRAALDVTQSNDGNIVRVPKTTPDAIDTVVVLDTR